MSEHRSTVAPSSSDQTTLHRGLIDVLVRDGTIRSSAVEAAFPTVPRDVFLPGVSLDQVYRDVPVVTKRRPDGVPITSSSQPAAMAIMLEQIDVQPGDQILEIGAGTGYNAALLAHLAGPEELVTSLDIDADIVAGARGCSSKYRGTENRLVSHRADGWRERERWAVRTATDEHSRLDQTSASTSRNVDGHPGRVGAWNGPGLATPPRR